MSGRYTPPKRHGGGGLPRAIGGTPILTPNSLGANRPLPVTPPPGVPALMLRMGAAVNAVIEAWSKCHAELHGAGRGGAEPVVYCGSSGLVEALDALAAVDRQAREAFGPPPAAGGEVVEVPR